MKFRYAPGSVLPRSYARVLLVLCLTACLEPTQATLELSTDAPCGGSERAAGTLFGVYIGASGGKVAMREGANVEAHTCDGGQVGSLVLFPEDGAKEATAVVVGVLGSREPNACLAFADDPSLDGTDCIVARRRIGFVDHKPLTVPVVLYAACAGVRCGEGFTCQPGAPLDSAGQPCVSSTVRCGENDSCDVETPPAQGGGGSGGGSDWGIQEVAGATGARHVFGVEPVVYFSVRTQEQGLNCADVQQLQSGVISPGTKVCQGSGTHDAALHVTGAPPVAFADVGDTAFVVGEAQAQWTVSAAQAMGFSDLYLRDENTAYAAFGGEVHRKALPNGVPELVYTPLAFGGMRHIWVHERVTPAADIVFFAGDSACAIGAQNQSCKLAVEITGSATPFADIWGAGGRLALVAGSNVISYDATSEDFMLGPTIEPLPLDGGDAVDLRRVFAVEPDGVAWVAGRSPPGTGALYMARGEPISSGGHTWTEHRFLDVSATPISLWAEAKRAFVVVDPGRLYEVRPPP